MNEQNVIMLRPGKEESLKRFHPWVFSGAIARKPDLLAEGDVVRVVTSNGNFLGVGHYQIGSIAVRILSFHDVPVDTAFYATIIEQAYRLRQTLQLIRPDNNTFRLVHGEGDHLPGLIVDIYGGTAVIQAHSVGMHKDLNLIVAALKQVLPEDLAEHVFYKSEGTLPYKADINAVDTYLLGGEQVQDVALENGLKFHIDWLKGQKTGFFIDQRDNRTLLEQYAEGRHVLNIVLLYRRIFGVCPAWRRSIGRLGG